MCGEICCGGDISKLSKGAFSRSTDIAPINVNGYTQWGKDSVKISSELARDRRDWGASVRDVVNSIGDTDSTRLG